MGQKYRLIAGKLRVQRGKGNTDLVVERPFRRERKTNSKVFLDGEDEPVLVEFDANCIVDIPSLISLGAIEEYHPRGGKS